MLLILQVEEHEHLLDLDLDLAPTEEPEPMEAEPVEAGNAVDKPTVDDPTSVRFTLTIDNFSSTLNNQKLYSNVFVSGGYKWKLAIFRREHNNSGHLSLFLDVADPWELPPGWTRCAKFSLSVVNQNHDKTLIIVCKTRTFALGDKPHSFFALEGKPPRRGLNPRPLACGNNLPKVTFGGHLS
nr:TRAF-like protein [Tanacetum cinerariifolium]